MNKLNTFNGGQPLFLNDVLFLDAASRDAITALVKLMTHGANRIIEGCILSDLGGGNYSISEGVVAINNELLYFPTTPITPTSILDVHYELSSVNTENRLFADSSNNNVYNVRTAKLIETASPTADMINVSAPSLFNENYQPIGTALPYDVRFITPEFLNEAASVGTVSSDDATPIFTVLSSDWLIKSLVDNDSVKFNKGQVQIQTLSPSPVTLLESLNFRLDKVFAIPPGTYKVLAKQGSTYFDCIMGVTLSTPTSFTIKKYDGSGFDPSTIYTFYITEIGVY